MELTNLLGQLGLSDKEGRMYLALLNYGSRPISYLAKQLHFNRGTAYVVLHSLLEKGLAAKSIRKKVITFTALDPKKLPDWVALKEQTFRDLKGEVGLALKQFLAIARSSSVAPRFMFYDGIEGVRIALNDTLNSKEKVLRAFLSIADIIDAVGDSFFSKYTDQRISKGYTLHVLRTLEKDKAALSRSTRGFPTSRKEKRIVKYLSDELAFPVSLYMYDNKILIISSKDEGFAAVIESSEFAMMQKKLFDLFWNMADLDDVKFTQEPRSTRRKR